MSDPPPDINYSSWSSKPAHASSSRWSKSAKGTAVPRREDNFASSHRAQRQDATPPVMREAQARVLETLEVQTRAVLEAVSKLRLQGEGQKVTLERLEEAICNRRATPAWSQPSTSAEELGEGAISLSPMVEPVMPTSPEALPIPDDPPPSTSRTSVAVQVPEEKLVEELGRVPVRCSVFSCDSNIDAVVSRSSEKKDPSQRFYAEEIQNVRGSLGNALMHDWLSIAEKIPSHTHPIPIVDDEPATCRSSCASFIKSQKFDTFTGCVIVVNAAIMGMQANHLASYPEDECQVASMVLDLAFTVFFLLELLMRIAVYKSQFFIGPEWKWNWFDLLVVLVSVCEEVIEHLFLWGKCGTGPNIGEAVVMLRIVRTLRMVRILRAIRLMQLFSELRLMVSSVFRCLLPLFWAILLLFVIQWSFSIYFVQISTDYIRDTIESVDAKGIGAHEPDFAALRQHWGSIWVAVYTLFMSVTAGADWGNAAEPLQVIGIAPVILYMAYISLTLFAVLNVVTGVFVENALKVALSDADTRVQECIDVQRDCIKNLLKVFDEVDVDGDGRISIGELEAHLQDRSVVAFLDCLGLTGVQAKRLFHLIDRKQTGFVDADAFVSGCMNLRGSAKAMDIAALQMDNQVFRDQIRSEMCQIKHLAETRQGFFSAQVSDSPTQ